RALVPPLVLHLSSLCLRLCDPPPTATSTLSLHDALPILPTPPPRAVPMPCNLGTPLSSSATRVLLLGAGELGKEVAIELQRLGVEVIAADRYADAPAMQVAHRSHVLDMLDGAALAALIKR